MILKCKNFNNTPMFCLHWVRSPYGLCAGVEYLWAKVFNIRVEYMAEWLIICTIHYTKNRGYCIKNAFHRCKNTRRSRKITTYLNRKSKSNT